MVKDGSSQDLYNESQIQPPEPWLHAKQRSRTKRKPLRGYWWKRLMRALTSLAGAWPHVLQDEVSAALATEGERGRPDVFPSVRREQIRYPPTSCCSFSLECSTEPLLILHRPTHMSLSQGPSLTSLIRSGSPSSDFTALCTSHAQFASAPKLTSQLVSQSSA